ncbi:MULTISPECIES: oxidoreductase [Mycobacteriaceae]|uniref:oxidoreductase n=1 Tax=Mycobacteriales TaxID=85007 RepID=UPI0005754519|nr:oxidoreductase [Mycobacterium sp. MS1601]AQA07179.1 oxidoreductase [Mycobacterium sp. MS1601]KHJ74042.1 quinone oxidoreductase [Rhodococcus sp. Chr-9]
MPSSTFRAFVVNHHEDSAERMITELAVDQLGEGDVTIRVDWSGVNYKDGLASIHKGNVARLPKIIPGIDLAGTVVESASPDYRAGDQVLVHGYDLGVKHHGGFSEMARVPAEWIVPLPAGLSDRDVMSLGTAGFTAALSVAKLEDHGLAPEAGPVLVTGATGGVGSVAVGILAARGYEVVAATGKESAKEWLTELGAAEIIGREEASGNSKPLQKERWAGAVDCVGGDTLANTLSALRYGAAVAASGNTGGVALPTTVFPFILRGVALLGVDSVQCNLVTRTAIWNRLATDLRPVGLDRLGSSEVSLDELPTALDRILAGENQGRTLVKLAG